MPTTYEALTLLYAAVLPGAAYVWAYERQVGNWGVGLVDRLVRFVGVSAVLHGAIAPLTYQLWQDHILSGAFLAGKLDGRLLWLPSLLYLGLPLLAGALNGATTRHSGVGILGVIARWKPLAWLGVFGAPSAAPRAWDHLFSRKDVAGWVRLRLHDGTWLGGAFAASDKPTLQSFAAGYPEDGDLFLAQIVDTDPETGAFLAGPDGTVVLRDEGLLIRWEEVAYLTIRYGETEAVHG